MSALIAAIKARHGIPTVDASSIDGLLDDASAAGEFVLLMFTGDPEQRSDSADVAVVLPELVAAFTGRYRAAIVAREDEATLRTRYGVQVFPSLVVLRGRDQLGLLPRIRDWSEYIDVLSACLDPAAPVLDLAGRPRVEITHSGQGD